MLSTSTRSPRSAGRTSSSSSSGADPGEVARTCRPTAAGACTGAIDRWGTASRRSAPWGRSCGPAESRDCSRTRTARRSAGSRSRRARSTRLSSARRSTGGRVRGRRLVDVCFTVDRDARGEGVNDALLAAAVEHAFAHGARALEAYPHRIKRGDYMGHVDLFRAHGFEPVREKAKRMIVRRSRA